jgi:hypothetical protein
MSGSFLIVQLQRLGARVISQSGKKVKKQPFCRLVLCLSPLTSHFRFPYFLVFFTSYLYNCERLFNNFGRYFYK